MEIKKNIRFEYYQVGYEENNENAKTSKEPAPLFDLAPVLERLQRMSLKQITIEYYDEQMRAERINYHENKYWLLQFVRLRGKNIPTSVKIDKESEPVELEDDEYMGEEISALYDPKLFVIALQRNKYSLSPSGIEEYFNVVLRTKLQAKRNISVRLRPLYWDNPIARAKRGEPRKLEIRFADLQKDIPSGMSASVSNILKSMKHFEANAGMVIISTGKVRKKQLNREAVMTGIDEVVSLRNAGLISSAKLTRIEDIYTEVIDLFEDKIHDIEQVVINKKRSITYSDIVPKLIDAYQRRHSEIAAKVIRDTKR